MTFFFSSRRRHTTFSRDWSSDVCSSDLALVSCGNTGALMAGGTVRLRTLDGIDRPALAAIIPRANGHFILIDAGANPQAEPEHLLHNALLGSHYARAILGVATPRVGRLTIGTEDGQGNVHA